MSEVEMDLEQRVIEQGWDAVRDPANIKVVKLYHADWLCVQFDPADTLVFPVESLTDSQRARLLEARPDLDQHVRLALQFGRERQGR